MPVRITCPNPDCGASYSVADEHLGRAGRCRKCGQRFTFSSTMRGGSSSMSPEEHDQPSALATGSMFGRYRIDRLLGRGGMGAVYLAFDTELHRAVALKVPHFSAEVSSEILQRFRREARAAAGFDHPNLCPVFDVGQFEGKYYLTMPYIEGQPMTSLLKNGPLPERRAAEVIRTLANALQEAHGKGVIHRDLKPQNIMVHPRRGLVVMDFGLARRSLAEDSLLTQSGALLGTPAYMAPEQVDGDPKSIGPATDVYALGVILYQLLTARLPFQGSTTSVLVQIKTAEPQLPSTLRPGLSQRLEAICRRAMAKRPEDRYGSMAELAAALSQLRTEPPRPEARPRPEPVLDPEHNSGPAPSGHRPLPVPSASRNSDGTITTFATLNFFFGGLGVLWSLFFIMSALSYPYADEPAGALVEFILGAIFVIFPAMIMATCCLTAGFGLLQRKVWGYYSHFIGAVLMAFTCIGIPYTVIALIIATRPEFSSIFLATKGRSGSGPF
ncbi:hypothetical protein BH23PLA1_BH23PLA1_25570 [soil metagenome]